MTPPARIKKTNPRKLAVKKIPDWAMLSEKEVAIAGRRGLIIVIVTAKTTMIA
jgi:hypothetical protein